MFWSLRFVPSDTRTATVLVDEFDAGHFIAASSWVVIRRPLTSPVMVFSREESLASYEERV
jgi:hypothetical protein